MRCRGRVRLGIALVAALLTITLLALLSAGVLAAVGRLREGSGLAARDAELMAAAEYALNATLIDWNNRNVPTLTVGQSLSFSVPVPGSTIIPTVAATRLQPALYWLVADAMVSDSSHRRINLLVRAGWIDVDSLAPLSAAGDVTLGAQATLIPADVARAAACAAPPQPAVVLGPVAQLLGAGAAAISASVVVRRASAANPASFGSIGGLAWADLERVATIVLAPNAVLATGPQSACTTGGATDWGDPRPSAVASCAQLMPLIYAAGDLEISGGVGQGVLLVQGHLHISGAFQFTGLIVALNGLQSDADGVAIDGAVISGATLASPLSPVGLTQQTTITGDPCAVQRIVSSALPPRPVRGRAWAELY